VKKLQRKAEFLPWTNVWSGGEGKVQQTSAEATSQTLLVVKVFREMVQKGKRMGPRTGKLRTSHSSTRGEEDTWNNLEDCTARISDLPPEKS